MPPKKILTIVGARPQFVKAAAVSRAIAAFPEELIEVIVHTGQHFDKNMSAIFFEEMEIPHPHYNLNINSLSHGAMTGRMLEEIEQLLLREQPDFVMVYGDTNSTLAGALAARKLHIKVIHVEAGLRSFNMKMPEEVNRILTDRISDILFCPTQTAIQNLEQEGFHHFDNQIELVGDVMQDAALFYQPKSKAESTILKQYNLEEQPYVLVTLHRAENTNHPERLKAFITGLNQLTKAYNIVLPLHPRTKKYLQQYGFSLAFQPIEPVGYLDMIQLISNASLVITDSGGLQKEAYFFQKYCLTLRDQTEWTELIDHGFNKLVPPETDTFLKLVDDFKDKPFQDTHDLYGGGIASQRIANIIRNKN